MLIVTTFLLCRSAGVYCPIDMNRKIDILCGCKDDPKFHSAACPVSGEDDLVTRDTETSVTSLSTGRPRARCVLALTLARCQNFNF